MPRDLDLMRSILLKMDERGRFDGQLRGIAIDGYDQPAIMDQFRRMASEGLIEVIEHPIIGNPFACTPTDITREGHKFLDAAREPTRWAQVVKGAGKELGGFSLAVIKDLLVKQVTG